MKGNMLNVSSGATKASIPFSTIYNEYRQSNDYQEVLNSYKNIINEILNQYKFTIDYSNVYPIVKSRDFTGSKDITFIRDRSCLDLDFLYVTDFGETFRFVLQNDNANFDIVRTAAWSNLNKMANIIEKLVDSVEVYSLRYQTDYASSLLFTQGIQRQVEKKLGKNYLFAIPAASTLLIAKDNGEYIEFLKTLIASTTDPSKVSSRVYRKRGEIYEYADFKTNLRLIK